jgi:hypothetical protein
MRRNTLLSPLKPFQFIRTYLGERRKGSLRNAPAFSQSAQIPAYDTIDTPVHIFELGSKLGQNNPRRYYLFYCWSTSGLTTHRNVSIDLCRYGASILSKGRMG